MRYFIFSILVLLLNSCDNDESQIRLVNGEEASLWQGASVLMPDGSTELKWGLNNDSRCPEKAICVWEGTAVIDFELIGKDGSVDFQLETNPTKLGKSISVEGFTIELIDVSPYPKTNISINEEDYEAHILVTEI